MCSRVINFADILHRAMAMQDGRFISPSISILLSLRMKIFTNQKQSV